MKVPGKDWPGVGQSIRTAQEDSFLARLEEAMQAEFFSASAQAHVNPDPAVSDQFTKEYLDILRARFPRHFAQRPPEEEALWDDPIQTENLLHGLEKLHEASTTQQLATLNRSQNLMQLLQQAPLDEQNTALVESTLHDIRTAQTALEFSQQQMPSLVEMFRYSLKLLSSHAIRDAVDPNLSQTERTNRVLSVLEDMRNSPVLNSQALSDASNGGVYSLAPAMKQLDTFMSSMRQMQMAANNSQLPDFTGVEAFQYQNLDSPTTIRVLEFIDQDRDAPNPNLIKLSMRVVDLDGKPSFNSLSYVWGDHRTPLNQTSNEMRFQRRFHVLCNGCKIAVTYNLFCCLRRLASAVSGPLRDVRKVALWIDQLCINQEDEEEKSNQVAMMGRIFHETQVVIAWLGENDYQTDAAIRLLETFKNVPKTLITQPNFDVTKYVNDISKDDWLALGALLSRSYFKRAWIVQEITLAKRPMILCGDQVIEWNDLVGCSRFIEKSRAWTALSPFASVFRSREEHLSLGRWRPPARFGGQLLAILTARETIRNQTISAENLLLLGRQFDASKTVDKFYAMLGMSRLKLGDSTSPPLPGVDYKQNLKHVALEFGKYHIKRSGRLRILSLVEDASHRSRDNLDFPSWLFDPASPLLPSPLEIRPPSSRVDISRNVGESLMVNRAPFVDGVTLVVQGYQIGIVEGVAEPFNKLYENDEWFRLCEFVGQVRDETLGGMNLGEALWRTLTTAPKLLVSKSPAMLLDLSQEFTDWCVSLIISIRHLNRTMDEQVTAQMMSKFNDLEEAKFRRLAFGKDAEDFEKAEGSPVHRLVRSSELMYDSWDKKARDSETKDYGRLARQLVQSLHDMWTSHCDDIFPSPAYIQVTTEILNPFKSDSPGRKEIEDRIETFKAALGTKLYSRRLYTTSYGRLGMGAQSLAAGDEIWVLRGAEVPFILRRLDQGTFRLVGETFLLGAMNGEVINRADCDLIELRLV